MGSTVLELSKLCMYELFYDLLQPSFQALMLHYMDTDSFVLSFSEGKVDDKYMDSRNLDSPIKTNNKVPGIFKHELGSREIEDFIVLKSKTYSLVIQGQNRTAKENGIKKENNDRHEEYYNALMDNKERIVEECRIQKVGDNMSTIKTSKRGLNNFDDKKFYVNNIKSYPLDENLYQFKGVFIKKICKVSLDQLMDLVLDNIDNIDNIDDIDNTDNKDNKNNIIKNQGRIFSNIL